MPNEAGVCLWRFAVAVESRSVAGRITGIAWVDAYALRVLEGESELLRHGEQRSTCCWGGLAWPRGK